MNKYELYSIVKYNMEKDEPKMLSWDITNKCNLFCKHCFNCSGDTEKYCFEDELSDDECIKLAQEIVLVKPQQLCICGGETLLRNVIFDVIKILSNAGICVNMVSNGILMTDDVAIKLKQSGINDVQISIDGLGSQHDNFRNREGAFKSAVNAVECLKSAGLSPVVSMVPNKINYASFPAYVEYISNLGAKSIRMMPLLPMGRGKINFDDFFMSSKEMFEFVSKLGYLKEKYPNMNIDWGDPLEHLYLVRVTRRRYPLVVSISSSGKLGVTPYLPITVGDVRKHSLKEYWDAGLNTIWRNKEIMDMIRKANTVFDFAEEFEPIIMDICEGC